MLRVSRITWWKQILFLAVAALAVLGACAPSPAPGSGGTAAKPTAAPKGALTGAPAPTPTAAVQAALTNTPKPTLAEPQVKRGTALEWYPLAEQVASKWQADAVLHSVVGGNIASDGSSLPCDGKAELWAYSFTSLSAEKKLTVHIQGGTVSLQQEEALKHLGVSPLPPEAKALYSNLYPSSDWKVDSTQAAQAANALFKEKYRVEPNIISYVMFNTKYLDVLKNETPNWMYWVISYDPEKYPFQVTLDARSGEVKERP